MLQSKLIRYLSLGIIIGIMSTFSCGFLLNSFILMAIILCIRRIKDQEERTFLLKLFVSGIALRVILILAIQYLLFLHNRWTSYGEYGNDTITYLFGDEARYTIRSWKMAQLFSGKAFLDSEFREIFIKHYAFTGYLYPLALYHYLCGFSPISSIFLNSIIGILTSFVYYAIGKELMGLTVAKVTAFLINFFPSLVIWSVTNLKESSFIFFTGIILWAFIRFLASKRKRYLLVLTVSLILQFFIRPHLLLPTLAILAIFYVLSAKKYLKFFIVFLLICTPLIIKFMSRIDINELKLLLLSKHRSSVIRGGLTYKLYDDNIYKPHFSITSNSPQIKEESLRRLRQINFLKVLLRGWLHYFLEPFPWRMISKLSIIAYPQMIIWYFLLVFSILGVFMQLRSNYYKASILIGYLFFLGNILSVSGGNIGTDFRIRDVLTPIIILFSVSGLTEAIYLLRSKLRALR